MSRQLHGHLCLHMVPRKKVMKVRLADHSQKCEVKYEGVIRLLINTTDYGYVKVMLVESETWGSVLVGRDLLAKHKQIPLIN